MLRSPPGAGGAALIRLCQHPVGAGAALLLPPHGGDLCQAPSPAELPPFSALHHPPDTSAPCPMSPAGTWGFLGFVGAVGALPRDCSTPGAGQRADKFILPVEVYPVTKDTVCFYLSPGRSPKLCVLPRAPQGLASPPPAGAAPCTSCRQGRSWRQLETPSSSQPELLKSSRASSSLLGTNAGGLQVPPRHVAYKSG